MERSRIDALLEGESLAVSSEVHELDQMYNRDPALYEEAGRLGLRYAQLALLAAGAPEPATIVDYGCLGGRVLRVLRAAFPQARLIAADINGDAARYCAGRLGAEAAVLDPNPAQVDLGVEADLIWCGSVLTHVDHRSWPAFLSLFERSLRPGGVAVFTAYGRYVAGRLRSGVNLLNLAGQEEADELVAELERDGAGFKRTVYDGECVVSRPWVCEQLDRVPSLDLVLYTENSWLTQDVIACVKAG